MRKDECERKEAIVFHTAMAECKSYLENLKFNEHEISTKVIQTNNDKLIYDEYQRVKVFLSCPIRNTHKYSDLVQEFKKMFEHIDRHANETTFVKCQDRSCCEEWKSPHLKDFLSKFGMKLFDLSTTVTLGHYDTFLQSCLKKENVYGSSGQLSYETNYLRRCNFCPSYHFKSKTGKRAQPNPKNFMCAICQATYSSLSSLNRHKKNKTYKKRPRRKTENTE